MPFNVLDTINAIEKLNFSQNFVVIRSAVLGTIFPGVKTQYSKAKYYRLMQGQNLPTPAFVHVLDSETRTGTRPTLKKALIEKLFIKEKINQSEQLQTYINNGVPDDNGLVDWVFDDMSRLSESVATHTKIVEDQVVSRGVMRTKENNLDMLTGFGVPAAHKITFGDWSNPEYDIFDDITRAVKMSKDRDKIPSRTLTSDTQVQRMRKNKGIQSTIYGNISAGKLVTMNELRSITMREFGLRIATCDEGYAYIKADGSRVNGRYFDEDKVIFYTVDVSSRTGIGLWEPTSGEAKYATFQEVLQEILVTVTMWATEDPVAKQTKASGTSIPVFLDIYGMVIATITTAENTIDALTVESSASSVSGATKLTVSPAKAGGDSYRCKIGDSETAVFSGQNVQTQIAWDDPADITTQTEKTITAVECNSTYEVLGAGSATVTAKAG